MATNENILVVEEVTDRPRFSMEEARDTALRLYGLDGSVKELPSERDKNYLLETASGERFVLKLSNAATNRELLECQNQAMQLLGEWNTPEADVSPRLRETSAGEPIAKVERGDGASYWTRLVTWVPGIALADARPHTREMLEDLGRFLGRLSRGLAGFSHPAADRVLHWDLKNAHSVVTSHLGHVVDEARRSLITRFLARHESYVIPRLSSLRTSVIHNDSNDHNLIVDGPTPWDRRVRGIIDFGDIVHSCTVFELAVCLAYVMLNKRDPILEAARVVRGYHEQFLLCEKELAVLFDLACMRLCTSVTLAAYQSKLCPGDDYLSISEEPAWQLLERLADFDPQLAHYVFRDACGWEPCPKTSAVVDWLLDHAERIGPVVEADLSGEAKLVFDLSVGSNEFGNPLECSDTEVWTSEISGRMQTAGAKVGIGRYNEARICYHGSLFQSGDGVCSEHRTIHVGVDLFLDEGSPVLSPLDGTVHSFQDNARELDYGPTIILRHDIDEGRGEFFTLYGHLSRESLDGVCVGKPVQRGGCIGRIGAPAVNGGWPPHLHFQLISDLLGKKGDFPGVAAAGQRNVWLSICPDPNLVLRVADGVAVEAGPSRDEIVKSRGVYLGKSLSTSYRKPLKIIRGWRQFLFDDAGRAYLDVVNNVCHVGHCHPHVVRAAQSQMAVLNTNTRYLHDNIIEYARRLTAKFPDPLKVCFFVCSGSEANDLALRLARNYTGHTDVVVVDGAYHGNLSSLVDISPYKFDGPGGTGAPRHVHKAVMPDGYRGPYKYADADCGKKYADHVRAAVEQAEARKKRVAAFFCESLLGCGGQIELPTDYLRHAFEHVRNAGGVCVADEVQVGFGRVGSHFWGFETQGVVPDVVTLGKPIGNGHPMAAVVTTPEIADAFANGMEYFNTFGGNPVSCAVGLAVLEVMERENLQHNARMVGSQLKSALTSLTNQHPSIGDVRGRGLFLGVELVKDRETLEPAADLAKFVVEQMKDRGILLSTDGPLHNVLKIKPPLVFSEKNAHDLATTLSEVLSRCQP